MPIFNGESSGSNVLGEKRRRKAFSKLSPKVGSRSLRLLMMGTSSMEWR